MRQSHALSLSHDILYMHASKRRGERRASFLHHFVWPGSFMGFFFDSTAIMTGSSTSVQNSLPGDRFVSSLIDSMKPALSALRRNVWKELFDSAPTEMRFVVVNVAMCSVAHTHAWRDAEA